MNLYLYQPHANQVLIHKSKAKYRVVVAGRRFGKSALGLNEALARAFQLKNQIIWIILPLFRQAKEIYWIDPDVTRYFMPYIQNGLIEMNKQELSLHVKSTNSWIRLKGSDNYDSLRGAGIDLIVWDETADVKEDAFDAIKPALADSPNHRMLYIGTPKGLNWFHDFAIRGDHRGIIPRFEKPITTNPNWESWHFTSYDNMSWPEGSYRRQKFVEYINEQRKEAEEKGKMAFFNQEYMASFEESAGRFFPKWSYKTHVLERSITPNASFEQYGSIDWGRQAPMAWYAHMIMPINWEGIKFNRVITFREQYDTNLSPYEHAEVIAGNIARQAKGKIDYTKILKTKYDPSMDTPQSDGSQSVADQFRWAFEKLSGKPTVMEAASNKRVSRWAAMDNWMRTAPDGLPYWLITTDCPNLIRTIPLMVPDKNKIEDIDTTLEDHGVDSSGYFLQDVPWVDAHAGVIRYKAQFENTIQSPIPLLDTRKFENMKEQKTSEWDSVK